MDDATDESAPYLIGGVPHFSPRRLNARRQSECRSLSVNAVIFLHIILKKGGVQFVSLTL